MISMFPFNVTQILCPVDRSELSGLALKYAVAGARVFGARLTVLEAVHVDVPRYLSEELTNNVLKELERYKTSVLKELEAYVRSIIGDAVDNIRVSYRVSDRQPAQAISETIEKAAIDLVVMGTHGYGGMKHWVLGSVTENLLHTSSVPIFAVRQKTDAFIDINHPGANPEILQILCPCDIGSASARALQVAASLAQRFDADLTALWSHESDDAEGMKRFQDWITQTLPEHASVRSLIKRGKAADMIIEAAAEKETDIIVIGARHRSLGKASVLGRTTELVLRHAPVPVLAVPVFDENV